MPHTAPSQRLCPIDHAPLTTRRIRRFGPEVRVDDCGKCGGLFLDRDELFHLTADHALNKRLRTTTHADEVSQRLCPHDGARMALEQTRGVEVEVCPKCHGLWLDADELEALAVRELA